MKPYLRRLIESHGPKVDPAGSLADACAACPELPRWQVAALLTEVRREPGESAEVEGERYPGDPFAESRAAQERRDARRAAETNDAEGIYTSAHEGSKPPIERGTHISEDGTEIRHTDTEINARIMNVDDLVEVAQIDLTKWEIVGHRVNTWGTVTKDAAGQPTVTRLWQVAATLRPRVIPLIPLDWPPPPVFVVPAALRAPEDTKTAVVLPDMQVGFLWRGLDTGRPWLEPLHCREAIDAALQVLARMQPDVVILIGDNLDFQPLSTRWGFGDDARQTTALAIREYAWLLHRIRSICPHSEIVYMLGNHEARLEKFLTERAPELQGLKHPDGRAALSLRALLGLDALQIATHAYPQPYWLWGRVEIEHGRAVRSGGGATAAAVLAKREHSVVYGHIHRAELAQRTVEGPLGRRQILAGSPGCLCVPLDTEILTRTGWKRHDQVKVGDETLGFADGRLHWTKVEAVVEYDRAPLVRMKHPQFDVTCTPDHRWVVERRTRQGTGKRWGSTMDTATNIRGEDRILLSAPAEGGTLRATPDEAALIGWILTDGTIEWSAQTGARARIYQSPKKWTTEVEALLSRLGEATTPYVDGRRGVHFYRIHAPLMRRAWAAAGLPDGKPNSDALTRMVLGLTAEARAAFWMALYLAEGNTTERSIASGRPTIAQRVGPVLDAISLASFLEGNFPRERVHTQHDHIRKVIAARPSISAQKGRLVVEQVADDAVWCVQTGLGSWVARQGRQIFLTGNCHTDGRVPGSDRPDWQQGIGVLTLDEGGDEDLQLLRIQRGRLFLGGEVIEGRDYASELVAATGATALLEPVRRAA